VDGDDDVLEDIDIVSKKVEIRKLKFENRQADKIRLEEEEAIREYMDEIDALEKEIDEENLYLERRLKDRNN